MLSVFRRITNEVNSKFVYKTDKELYGEEEHWTELKEVDGKLYGDCEDYVLTIANRVLREGVPRKDLRIHLVSTGRTPDHLILEYKGWYADCNFKGLTKKPPYRKISYRQLDQKEWQHS